MAGLHFRLLGRRFITLLETAGDLGLFAARVVRDAFRRPFEIHEIGRQIVEIGTRSVPLDHPLRHRSGNRHVPSHAGVPGAVWGFVADPSRTDHRHISRARTDGDRTLGRGTSRRRHRLGTGWDARYRTD